MSAKKHTNKSGKVSKAKKPPPQAPPPPASPPMEEAPDEAVAEEVKPLNPGPPVVGIGASAGGLESFKKFFAAMPADSGLVFVLIPHLDPTHESLMVELLSRHTSMPVIEATEGMAVEANHVYIIPPNKYQTIAGGVLRLTGPVERRGVQTSIDLFLRSLADDQQEKAICIILSGTGAHGSLGLKAIKANGGMAMVQEPRTAEYSAMPQNAIATGLADFILPVEQMPEALIKYAHHSYFNGAKTVPESDGVLNDLNRLLALLRARVNFDFRSYRKKMLLRRVERRIGLTQCESLGDYVAYVREHPDEAKHLARDLLISVTSFFRDAEAFAALEKDVIAPLVRDKCADGVLRVWVPGCATGEEAYSMAILFHEQLIAARKNCRVQVFATDVDTDALATARHGIYPDSIAADITPERLQHYFTRVDDSNYQVNKLVRESITFAVQNVFGDPPFSKMDLVSCRNLLIYVEPEMQRRIIPLLHFALNEGGFLFLGPSETIGRHLDLFETISRKWRLYRRIGPNRLDQVEFSLSTRRDPQGRLEQVLDHGEPRPGRFAQLAQRLLLEEFAPAAVLINRKHEIIYFSGPITRYLDVPTGEPTQDLMLMAREGLRTKLRAAIHKATRDREAVTLGDIQVKRQDGYHAVMVTVKPMQSRAAEGLLLITFQEADEAQPAPEPLEPAAEESLVRQLEYELRATREDLQSTVEELESSNEELKGSNEEVMSVNEELQSANEELETSKEELQSLNEELTTVNSQLQDKVHELEATNNDMVNLLNCTDIATMFLDTGLHIRLYNPPTTRLLNLIATDIGRPLRDITLKFADPDLLHDAEQVLRDLIPREKDVHTSDDRWCLRRLMPYRTTANRIEGVVLTLIDVTQLKESSALLEAEVKRRTAALSEKEERLRAILNGAEDTIVTIDRDGLIESVNPAAERMFGYRAAEMIGQNVTMLMPAPYNEEHDDYLRRYQETGQAHIIGIVREVSVRRKDGSTFPVDLAVSEVKSLNLYMGILRDITQRKRLEQEVVEIAALEQRRIGQDLHDDCGQELTALGLLVDSLEETLPPKVPAAVELVRKIEQGLQRVLRRVRSMSRGLALAEVEPKKLPAALSELTSRLSETSGVRCVFQSSRHVSVVDSLQATHLYHIAQEACTNAFKHAQATNVTVQLESTDGEVVLKIQDDGQGISKDVEAGLGMRIMRNRASLIGATLAIEPAKPQGTVVTCFLGRKVSNGSKQSQEDRGEGPHRR